MAGLTLKWSGNGIAQIDAALTNVSSGRARAGLRRAINHTGDRTFTAVKRALAQQVGLSQQALFSNGRTIKRFRASNATMQYVIATSGRAIPMMEFKPSVSRTRGVRVKMWDQRFHFPHAFQIGAGARWGSGNLRSGGIYQRLTKSRFPLEALLGANINKELVKDMVAATFEQVVSSRLPARTAHEISRLTNGAFS